VGKSGGELRKEGEMTLLAGGKWSASLGNGCDQGFVICEQGEQTAFKEKTEVADSKVGIAGFSRRKFVGEKGKGLPGTTGFLLQHGSHVGIRGICGEGKDSRGNGMMEGNSRS
jgi:hypothetical protein